MNDRGVSTVMVVLFMLPIIAMAGLVYEAGNRLSARQAAINTAEEAARAGAQTLAGASRSGSVVLSSGPARAAASDFCAAAGYRCDVSVGAAQVQVTAYRTVPTSLLTIVGITSYDVAGRGTALAVPVSGAAP